MAWGLSMLYCLLGSHFSATLYLNGVWLVQQSLGAFGLSDAPVLNVPWYLGEHLEAHPKGHLFANAPILRKGNVFTPSHPLPILEPWIVL